MAKKWTSKAIKVGISIPEDLNAWAEKHASEKHMSLSKVYRLAIEDYYSKVAKSTRGSDGYEQLLEETKKSIIEELDKRYVKKKSTRST